MPTFHSAKETGGELVITATVYMDAQLGVSCEGEGEGQAGHCCLLGFNPCNLV
jgi:hypothetical protein